MYTLLIIFYVLVSVSLIGLVLIQQGKGADAGAAFGSGASGTMFGARGSANFLSKSTAVLATVFFALSLALAYVVHGRTAGSSVVDAMPAPAAKVEIPAAPMPAAPKQPGAPATPPSATPAAAPPAPAPAPKTDNAPAPAAATPATGSTAPKTDNPPPAAQAPAPATPKVPN
jgi:preprotein translocase subunit SecG